MANRISRRPHRTRRTGIRIFRACGVPIRGPCRLSLPRQAFRFSPGAASSSDDRADGSHGKDDPAAYCVPGMPKLVVLPYPYKIVQVPGMMLILYEGFTTYRQIFTDGRALPKDPQPSWLGYSVGKWDGDTFVVDTIGVNEHTWLDNAGRPHSEAMHLPSGIIGKISDIWTCS